MIEFPDLPIASRDQDKLGRKAFANEIARGIANLQSSDSVAIGLYGGWGSGKSSILNMVKEALKEDYAGNSTKPRVVEFKPWNYSNHADLITQFFADMEREIGIVDKSQEYQNIASAFGAMAKASGTLALIPPMSKGAIVLVPIFKFAKVVSEYIARKQVVGLSTAREEISERLRMAKGKIVVFIDDIDRLNTTETQQIFQLVKSLADFTNVVYFLAFDDQIVSSVLDNVSGGKGREYLDKIVQIPFHVPSEVPNHVRHFVLAELMKMVNDRELDKWDELE